VRVIEDSQNPTSKLGETRSGATARSNLRTWMVVVYVAVDLASYAVMTRTGSVVSICIFLFMNLIGPAAIFTWLVVRYVMRDLRNPKSKSLY